ncbi:MAG: peptide chain release factor 2 [Eubacteriales bacterium]|nr:peptide chain release factor 2 [Eubacteriales bacterium]MDO5586324.1 peptide chain release factor 2 [Clostridia bacterium]MDY4212324.1 peptide chain release factor 2 [Eubacteriales bacterium]MDY5230411.1 peptide chain release factor 2 [Eubacteriales bacterium]
MIAFDEYKIGLDGMEKDITDLGIHFSIEKTENEIKELEAETVKPDFYNDMNAAGKTMQKIKGLRDKIARYRELKSLWDDLKTLVELAIEEDDESVLDEVKTNYKKLTSDLENMKLETLLSGKYDKNNAIITLHAGAGGTEAQDWCEMLYRMYTHWAERRGYSVETLDFLDGEEAGLKSITFLVEGLNAYGYAKCEKGVHRLVRISPFDSAARRHTSFASCEVMPEIDDDIEVDINPEDLRVDTYRSSGAGGQHINKTESAIRITHIPTGVVVTCQNERSQHKNRETAMKMLKSKLIEIAEREQKEKIEDLKGVQMEIGWGSQIRSYVFHPYTMVKDHRTNYEVGNINAVMDGDIDGFINAYLIAKSRGEL